ncbi:Virus X resistance protein-like, coiled-coil domain [Sesbania bispinosa]|nr:Virus X resistance protein-like, coiled-coil domain [Sesbania bispinosa]
MAEVLLGLVFEKLLSLIQNEFATMPRIKEKAEKLLSTSQLIKVVLQDAEEKQMTEKPVKLWLQKLKDAVYVLDDILDECSIESHRLRGPSSFKPRNIVFRYRIGNKLKMISRRFDEIAESKNKIFLREHVWERSGRVAEWRETTPTIIQPQIYGRDDDKEKIVEFLLNQARASDFLSIYPIVGLGGVGKTTLAQMVYNDDRVRSTFNTQIWICVSEDFSLKRILCSIIRSISDEKCDVWDLHKIGREVQELLQSKRYLLVFDDVWKMNQELKSGLTQDKWNKLKSLLSCGSKGASILVSTRDRDVATIMGTCQAHHLSCLSDHECWLLFKQCAFANREEREELVAIGKEIVKKCGGLPLAARALGSLLYTKSEEKEWLEVKESRLWDLQDENSILPALRLSYVHLMPALKQCFAFCAIFPKDEEIMKEDLIHLWMANGFISSMRYLEVEDVGNMIWNELDQKSFFQDIKINYEGDISFKMHNLIHDLAQSEWMVFGNSNVTDSLTQGFLTEKIESLRTLHVSEVNDTRISSCFHSLRVLRTCSFTLLSSLANLIHLRYLELYDLLEIETLPDSIYSLQKLEILKLKRLRDLLCLPEHLTCLQNLRHLIVEDCLSLSQTSPNIRKLCCLKSLTVYIVDSKTGHSLAELRDLNLGGKLSIEGLANVGSLSEARMANLIGKKDLKKLCLSWYKYWDHTGKTKSFAEKVIEVLQPPPNLKSLEISNYHGLCLPGWIMNLNSLVDLKLIHCYYCLQIPSLAKLPFLRKLEIRIMHDVQYVDDDECYDGVEVRAFPSLEELYLDRLPKLERLLKVEKGEMFLRLSNVTILDCPKLWWPCLLSVKCLKVKGCKNELLKSIASMYNLTSLHLEYGFGGEELTCFPPEGMLRNLTCLQTLVIDSFPEMKELSSELFNLIALEDLSIRCCHELESLPEQGWEGLCSLQYLSFYDCGGLRSLPDGIQHLTSLHRLRGIRLPPWINICFHNLVGEINSCYLPMLLTESFIGRLTQWRREDSIIPHAIFAIQKWASRTMTGSDFRA